MKIKFIQKIIDKIKIFLINERCKKSNFIHLMFNDKFNKPFVDFINKNYKSKDHLFLCKKWHDGIVYPFPEGKNVIKVKKYENLNLFSAKKIIAHSFFDAEIIDIFYEHKELLSKGYWMIWGGDLYNAKQSFKHDYVRKNIYGYITDVDDDAKFAIEKYDSNPIIVNAGYTFPITMEMILNTKKEKKSYIQIQINNSCDYSTLEMLDILSKFKNENIKIITILSYGDIQYKEEIINKGKMVFGDKFSYIDNLLSFEDYTNHLANNDILILNQNRQQGLGNIFASLALGSKVFIKSDVTTFSHLISKDLKIFDTYQIEKMNFNNFINISNEIKELNITNSKKFFSDKYLKTLWNKVFKEYENAKK